ncbi:MAG: hypothetical protein ACI94Y_004142 [Maribacter sp.]|jgi:hypothetical protein
MKLLFYLVFSFLLVPFITHSQNIDSLYITWDEQHLQPADQLDSLISFGNKIIFILRINWFSDC